MPTPKENREAHKLQKQYKKEHYIDPWRGTGRTTRELFSLASMYPSGSYLYICHNHAMARYAFHKFMDIQTTFGAPIEVNPTKMEIKLHDATYKFAIDSEHLRRNIRPSTTVIEDHMIGELRSVRHRNAILKAQELKEKHDRNKPDYFMVL